MDPRHSPLVLRTRSEVENDELLLPLVPIAKVGGWRRRKTQPVILDLGASASARTGSVGNPRLDAKAAGVVSDGASGGILAAAAVNMGSGPTDVYDIVAEPAADRAAERAAGHGARSWTFRPRASAAISTSTGRSTPKPRPTAISAARPAATAPSPGRGPTLCDQIAKKLAAHRADRKEATP